MTLIIFNYTSSSVTALSHGSTHILSFSLYLSLSVSISSIRTHTHTHINNKNNKLGLYTPSLNSYYCLTRRIQLYLINECTYSLIDLPWNKIDMKKYLMCLRWMQRREMVERRNVEVGHNRRKNELQTIEKNIYGGAQQHFPWLREKNWYKPTDITWEWTFTSIAYACSMYRTWCTNILMR